MPSRLTIASIASLLAAAWLLIVNPYNLRQPFLRETYAFETVTAVRDEPGDCGIKDEPDRYPCVLQIITFRHSLNGFQFDVTNAVIVEGTRTPPENLFPRVSPGDTIAVKKLFPNDKHPTPHRRSIAFEIGVRSLGVFLVIFSALSGRRSWQRRGRKA
jgi:hypothetical protein